MGVVVDLCVRGRWVCGRCVVVCVVSLGVCGRCTYVCVLRARGRWVLSVWCTYVCGVGVCVW